MSAASLRILGLRPLAAQFTRFCTVGVLNTLITLAVFRGLEALAVGYLEASAAGFAAGAANGYVFNRAWTFGQNGRFWTYSLVQGLGLGVNVGVLAALVGGLGAPHLLAQVVALPVASVATFGLSRRVVFIRA